MLLIGAIALALLVLPPGWGIALVGVAAAIEVAEVGFWIRFLRRYRVRTGVEGLIGSSAEVIEPCDPRGRVRFRGEIWHAALLLEGRGRRAGHGDGSQRPHPGGRAGPRLRTEKGPGEGALCIRKDVPPAKFPFTGPSVLQVLWLNVGRIGNST